MGYRNTLFKLPICLCLIFSFSYSLASGKVEIAKWKDAKAAAFSFTIDDNHAKEHEFWLQQSRQFGYFFTWFVIAGIVEGGTSGDIYYGKWSQWRRLVQLGHDIQSHSYYHFHKKYHPQQRLLHFSQEYSLSKKKLMEKLSLRADQLISIAYPNGLNKSNSRQGAAQHYSFARGVSGGINRYGTTDFLNVRSNSNARGFSAQTINQMIEQNGWYVSLFHKIQGPLKAHVQSMFHLLKNQRDSIWVGTFTEVAQYMKAVTEIKVQISSNHKGSLKFNLVSGSRQSPHSKPISLIINDPRSPKTITQRGRRLNWKHRKISGKRKVVFDAIPKDGPIQVNYSN